MTSVANMSGIMEGMQERPKGSYMRLIAEQVFTFAIPPEEDDMTSGIDWAQRFTSKETERVNVRKQDGTKVTFINGTSGNIYVLVQAPATRSTGMVEVVDGMVIDTTGCPLAGRPITLVADDSRTMDKWYHAQELIDVPRRKVVAEVVKDVLLNGEIYVGEQKIVIGEQDAQTYE